MSLFRLLLLLTFSAVPLAPATAVELGDRHTARFKILAAQIPLPDGEWTVVGKGTNVLVSGAPGAYGTIENVILARVAENRVDGLVEINVNRLPVEAGWGSAGDCGRTDGLATVAFYKTPVDGFCFFVAPTAVGTADAPGPAAWDTARPVLHGASNRPSPVWLTVGFRVSDRRDVLDVRYHFDPQSQGIGRLSVQDWALEPVLATPNRHAALNKLTAWGGLAAGLIEDGFRGALSEASANAPLPYPWEVEAPKDAEAAQPNGDAHGRVSKTARLERLDALLEAGAISKADHAAYQKAIEDTPPPESPDDYYRLLGMKVVSFNFFRVSVDYILAFVVTVNSLISGYITATIVATHSVAQVFNDMWWDNYIATQAAGNSKTVDFIYVGVVRPGAV